MTLVAITAVFSFLVTNGYYQVGLPGSIVAALLFGVCQVGTAATIARDGYHVLPVEKLPCIGQDRSVCGG
jgi:hypothetical protein